MEGPRHQSGLDPLSGEILAAISDAAAGEGRVVFLTGAGISAESGIPTFRGEEGYWTSGSEHHKPMDLATARMFGRDPRLVWSWYLYRLGVCRDAEPNRAHTALADLEVALQDRFLLITQNVDGLHLRAGNTPARTFRIHGDLEWMRCTRPCSTRLHSLPDVDPLPAKEQLIDPTILERLRCPDCSAAARPHVLWFDEYYDEELFFWESSHEAVSSAQLLVSVGTSGATNLPTRLALLAIQRGIPVIDVNPRPDHFGPGRSARWFSIPQPAAVAVPELGRRLAAASATPG